MSSPVVIYEPARVLAWLDSKLSAVATANGASGAFEGVAPDSVTGYYIVYNFVPGTPDVAGVAGIRLWHSGLYQVVVRGPVTSYAALVATADAIEQTLQLAGEQVAGVASDGYIMRCVREMPLVLPAEIVSTVQWAGLGAYWRIQARKK